MNSFTLTEAEKYSEALFLNRLMQLVPSNLFKMDVSKHAEEKRILPPGTPRPGPLDLSYTPYLIEPMDHMSPSSIIQEVVIMKGAQLGFTMAAECIINFFIGEDPADQLFISASSTSIEKWSSRRLEPSITSYGHRKLIIKSDNTSGKRSADKMFSKEYFGMRLDMASAQSASSMRSTDKRILIRDEIDGAPPNLKTGEGNWLEVSEARTSSWADRRKIFDLSTPTNFETSQIYKRYLEGDQCHFMVPCPHCNETQALMMENLIDVVEDGLIVNAYYACECCGKAIYNYHKRKMYESGLCHFKPTAKPKRKTIKSFYVNSLYSPIGMLTFTFLAQKREKANNSIDPDAKKAFTNLYEGLPFKETGKKPKVEMVMELRGTYEAGTVPDMVLFITIAVDVQRGSKKDTKNPPRLEMEVLGHGPGYRTFSIMYKTFVGKVEDPFSGAWEDLNDWATENSLIFRKKDGTELYTALTFIDSGDGTLTNVVYQFCQRWSSTFPIKGYQNLDKNKGIDKTSATDYKRYKRSKVGEDTVLYNVSTNYYKNMIYNNLKIKRIEGDIQSPGFSDFPISYTKKYFNMLTAEEKMNDGNFHLPEKKRNEALDIRCYALCAADVYLDSLVHKYREALKKKGGSEEQLLEINRRWVIESLKTSLNVID